MTLAKLFFAKVISCAIFMPDFSEIGKKPVAYDTEEQ